MYTGNFDCYGFKAILRSFGVFPIIDPESWWVVEENGVKYLGQ